MHLFFPDKRVEFEEGRLFPKVIYHFRNVIAKTWPRQYLNDFNVPTGEVGRVNNVRYYGGDDPKLTISVFGNRYCLNVGERHKKNNIFFQVYIKNFTFVLKCHNDTCSKFYSPEIDLPPELLFSLQSERDSFS